MARALRPRKERPSYASFIESDNEAAPEEEGSSGDDFQPPDEQGAAAAEDAEIDLPDVESQGVLGDEDDLASLSEAPEMKKSQKKRAKKASFVSSDLPRTATGHSRSGNRSTNVPPMSILDHRQRAEPLYFRPARVERLTQPPLPFEPPVTTSTHSWNSSRSCAERFTKANGFNIGRGPIWELLEDRSWWKESHLVGIEETETEAIRRPRVYESVRAHAEQKAIGEQDAQAYLPTRDDASNEPSTPAIKCFFGPPGKNVLKEVKTFDSLEMIDEPSETKALVFFAGGPVWGLDWCPIYAEEHPCRSYKQYVAVAPLPSKSHRPRVGHKCSTPSPACIQIWSYSPEFSERISSAKQRGKAAEGDVDFGKMTCELILCLECGPAQEIKWCPLPAHDPWGNPQANGIRKLGLLAGTFEDGSLSIFVVPDPEDLRPATTDGPAFVSMKPIVRIELEETCIWCLDWANSERIVVGCTNGSVAVYDIHDALVNNSMQDVLPSHYFCVHQSAIRSIRWIPVPSSSADGVLKISHSPTMIASGGYDGCEIVTDIRDGFGSILNRTRDVVLATTYSHFTEGIVTIDLDYNVKTYSMAPGILGRGNVMLEAGGPIWSLHTSDYHPFLAVGSADGSLLITNMLRAARRSAATPFLYHKVFQMDYSRKTGEYRMLDHFLPQEIPDRSSSSNVKKGKKQASKSETLRTGIQGTGAWSPEVSVTRVSWNNGGGLARAPLLASATASGLCRIDWLLGQFQDEQVPCGGVEFIRNEINTGVIMDEDDDE